MCGNLVIAPREKCVDIETWRIDGQSQQVGLFSASTQDIEIHNVGRATAKITINGVRRTVHAGKPSSLRIKKRVDPARKAFFAADFLDEPTVKWIDGSLPY